MSDVRCQMSDEPRTRRAGVVAWWLAGTDA